MKYPTLNLLACPICHGLLKLSGEDEKALHSGTLTCSSCAREFPIVDGIPHFIQPQQLTGFNRRFSRMYDWFSWGYRAFSKLAFAYINLSEEAGRREITDRLEPNVGKVLEISIGPGVNLPYIMNRTDVSEVFGLDISLGQLRNCQRYAAKKGWGIDLFLGNAEQLPFKDDAFDSVFHVGGINFFNDKKSAIDEMIRVAKSGTRILIADETERGAEGYEKVIPGFKGSFDGRRNVVVPPLDLIPREMLETRMFHIWKGWFYCIEFRKP